MKNPFKDKEVIQLIKLQTKLFFIQILIGGTFLYIIIRLIK